MTADDQNNVEFQALVEDLKPASAFLTRVPLAVARSPGAPDLGRAARVFPVVGGLIGIAEGIVLLLALWLALPAWIAAALAVGFAILLTGALHEDGLADTVDGFGGGQSAERKLDIMDDSRIGSYGALALVFAVVLRIATLSSLIAAGGFRAALGLVAAEAVSRGAMVRLWHSLPAARVGSLSDSAGTPDERAMLIALAASAIIVVITIVPAFGVAAAIVASLVLVVTAYGFTRLTSNQIGGRTGDTLGACQQVALIAFLVGLAPFA
jgi:adenosylcobinamide-GDP ribazoletransferase